MDELPSFQVACFAINKHEKDEVRGLEVPWGLEVQKEEEWREKKKEEKKKLNCRRIATAIDFYIILQSFFGRSSFFVWLVLALRIWIWFMDP